MKDLAGRKREYPEGTLWQCRGPDKERCKVEVRLSKSQATVGERA